MTWKALSDELNFGIPMARAKKKKVKTEPLPPVVELAKTIYPPEWRGDLRQKWLEIVENANEMRANLHAYGGYISVREARQLVIAQWIHDEQ
tara:strand:- start:2238 stop:2513 length:276 start_codon:yes stop_codon:yes gene_type:complete